MTSPESRISVFFEELRRRKVYRVAVVYAVAGFALIEAADIIFPTLSVPDHWFTVLLVTTLAGFPFALVSAWIFDLTSKGFTRTAALPNAPGTTRPAQRGIPVPSQTATEEAVSEKSVAVLPFANMSEESQNEYFSDGVTEEIISALTKVPGLRVAARTSSFRFKGLNEDVTEIGRRLRVATVLEGSVRKAGERVRITAQLVKVADGYHIWSEVYDRELADIFAVQEEIARTIVGKLKVELLDADDAPLVQRHTENLEAYNLYLKGRFFWNQREGGLAKGIEYFDQAIEADENYALAYAGIADSYNLLGFYGFLPAREAFPQAKARAKRALELDPDLGEAHVSLAFACMLYDWDWTGAEGEFRRGLELSPGYATGHHWFSEFLMAMGQADQAIVQAERAVEIDPIGLIINTLLGMAYYFAREHDRAIEACLRTLELLPDFVPVYLWLGFAYVQKGRHEEAIEIFERARERSDDRPAMTALLGYANAAGGRREEAEAMLLRLRELSRDQYVSAFDRARIYVALGETATALDELEAAFEERAMGLVWLRVDPTLDAVRDEPAFQDLLRRMDFPH